jgi:hypothetical protein
MRIYISSACLRCSRKTLSRTAEATEGLSYEIGRRTDGDTCVESCRCRFNIL